MPDFTLQTGTAAERVEGRFAAALRRWWQGLEAERRVRVTTRTLQGLDDRALNDIGLKRDDIESAVRSRLLDR